MKSRSCSRSAWALGLSSKSTADTSFESQGGPCRLRHLLVTGGRAWSPSLWGTPARRRVLRRARHDTPYGPRMETETVGGIAQDHVARWLAEHVAGLAPPFRYELIAGGRSNLTYDVLDANGRRVVLRRPPLGNVLQSAHDMGREHRIIAALASTDVPVAEALGYCEDPSVNGAPFYVMGSVAGAVLATIVDAEKYPEGSRRPAAEDLVDVMCRLHAVDPDAVGLGALAR